MATIQKQVRMVFDLNKCLGCQACTMACKTAWTDKSSGSMYMYWNNVETRPGRGYPRNWFVPGQQGRAGIPACDTAADYDALRHAVATDNALPDIVADYGAPWEYDYQKLFKGGQGAAGASRPLLRPEPGPNGQDAYAANWDEDVGAGEMPNAFYFYLPRICNHCTKPACLAACPRQALYKREEDGIVLVDQSRCRGYRYCVKGCPYKKVYYNPNDGTVYPDYPDPQHATDLRRLGTISQKCIFCYPRIEKFREDPDKFLNPHSFCFTQCVGRVRYAGFFYPGLDPMHPDNQKFNVNKLIYEHKVALQLYPEFGTEPNLYYIPPLSPPAFDAAGRPVGPRRIPVDALAELFGDGCGQSPDDRKARIGEIFGKLEAARSGGNPDLQSILIAHSEGDRLQLHLGL